MKYSKGDKVRVRKDLILGRQYGNVIFDISYVDIDPRGEVMEIIHVVDNSYNLKNDKGRYYYAIEEMLEPVEEHENFYVKINNKEEFEIVAKWVRNHDYYNFRVGDGYEFPYGCISFWDDGDVHRNVDYYPHGWLEKPLSYFKDNSEVAEKVSEELTEDQFEHGMSITCEIDGVYIEDAKLEEWGVWWYICHNNNNFANCEREDNLGYEYAIAITHPDYKVTNIRKKEITSEELVGVKKETSYGYPQTYTIPKLPQHPRCEYINSLFNNNLSIKEKTMSLFAKIKRASRPKLDKQLEQADITYFDHEEGIDLLSSAGSELFLNWLFEQNKTEFTNDKDIKKLLKESEDE